MKRTKFYVCPICGNALCAAGEAEISCCGRKLSPLVPQKADGEHTMELTLADDEYYITFAHEMSKEHYLSFVAYVLYDRVLWMRLYPEQDAAVRLSRKRGGQLYYCCSQHGLFQADTKLK